MEKRANGERQWIAFISFLHYTNTVLFHRLFFSLSALCFCIFLFLYIYIYIFFFWGGVKKDKIRQMESGMIKSMACIVLGTNEGGGEPQVLRWLKQYRNIKSLPPSPHTHIHVQIQGYISFPGVWERLGEKVRNNLKCLKSCAFQCNTSLKMGFCEEQKCLTSD